MTELHKWQLDLIDNMTKYKGRGSIQMTGRGVGKSLFSAQALKRLMEDLYNRPVEDLVLSEGKVFGARYYCVEPVGGNWLEMEAWAIQVYGEPAEVWNVGKNEEFIWPDCGRWYKNDRRFWFRDEKDRTMFLLKWR